MTHLTAKKWALCYQFHKKINSNQFQEIISQHITAELKN